jgi:glycogen debranching enzyme
MSESSQLLSAAWEALEKSVVFLRGEPVGTVAARDPDSDALNYDQCFTRDFAVSAVAFLMRGRSDIVRNFLSTLVSLQQREEHMDCFRAGKGLMPASFAIQKRGSDEVLVPDFGENAIGRVAPVDSGFWWLMLLRAYTKATGDMSVAGDPEFQQAIRLILEMGLRPRFDMYPTMLVPDGSYMIDRRMGVYGYPFDIQALLFVALSSALELLPQDDPLMAPVADRLHRLTYHLQRYYWLDFQHLNQIYRYKVEEYGSAVLNAFNIYPESIPEWIMSWLPINGGFFAGNLGPGRMDFRYFAQGNMLAALASLASNEQAQTMMDLIEERWDDLMGAMPCKLCYPAIRGRDWHTITGADPKNTPWSYHNGGNWPFLLWLLTGAAIRAGRVEIAQRALDIAERRIGAQQWPEYYDGREGRFIGKEARSFQTWSLAGFIAAHDLLAQPAHVDLFSFRNNSQVADCLQQVAEKIRREQF